MLLPTRAMTRTGWRCQHLFDSYNSATCIFFLHKGHGCYMGTRYGISGVETEELAWNHGHDSRITRNGVVWHAAYRPISPHCSSYKKERNEDVKDNFAKWTELSGSIIEKEHITSVNASLAITWEKGSSLAPVNVIMPFRAHISKCNMEHTIK